MIDNDVESEYNRMFDNISKSSKSNKSENEEIKNEDSKN